MTINNNIIDSSSQIPLVSVGKQPISNEGVLAEFIETAQALKGTLGQIAEKIPTNSSKNQGPSDAQMEQMLGELYENLTQLQCNIAQFHSQIEGQNSKMGNQYMLDANAQLQNSLKELKEIASKEKWGDFFSIFSKVFEGILGAILTVTTFGAGDVALACLMGVSTALNVTGLTGKITDGIADALTPMLKALGVPDTIAKDIANVVASIAVIGITIGVTIALAPVAIVEDTVEEMGQELENINNVDSESVIEEVNAPESQQTRLTKILNGIKKTLQKLPASTRYALIAGLQAASGSNLVGNTMTLSLSSMSNQDKAKVIASAVGMAVGILLNMLAGAFTYSLATDVSLPKTNNMISELLSRIQLSQVLTNGGIAVAFLQFAGDTGYGIVNGQFAVESYKQGITQAALTLIQQLMQSNAQIGQSDSQEASSKQETWTKALMELGRAYNETGRALAKELAV